MGHLFRQGFVLSIAVALSAIPAFSTHASEDESYMGELALPCEDYDASKNVCSVGLRPCNEWKSESGRPIKGVKDELITHLDRRFKVVRDGLYMDKQIILYKATPEDKAKSGGYDLVLPAPGGGTRGFVAVTDLKQVNDSNSFEPYDGGRACYPGVDDIRRTGRKHHYVGAPERVRADPTRGSVTCGFPGFTDRSGNNYLAGADGEDRPGNRISLEVSYRKGAGIAAMDCYLAQVKEEIRKGKFTVRSPACKAIAADIRKLYVSAKDTGSAVLLKMDDGKKAKNLCSQSSVLQAMKPVPDFCSNEETAESGTVKDKNDNQIVGCQLASMRANIEAAFVELLSCEVHARAMEGRNIAFVDTGKKQRDSQFSSFYEQWLVKGKVVSKYTSEPGPGCEARAESFARSKGSRRCRKPCAEAHGAREASRCYDQNIEKLWSEFLEYHFPQNGECKHTFHQQAPTPDPQAPWGLLLGSLVLPGVRRRRKVPVYVGPSLIIVGMAFFWAACGGKGGGKQGVAQYPPYNSVSRNNNQEEDRIRLAEAQKGAADRNRAAMASAFQADRLAKGGDKEVGNSMQNAAKAGTFDKKNVEFSGRGAKEGDASGVGKSKTAGTGGGGGGPGAGGGGGGGLGGGGSGASTEPGSLLTLQGEPGGMVEDGAAASAGLYVSGKGGGGTGGKGSKNDNPFGSGAGVDGGNSTMQFGAGTGKGDVNAMGSEDPADYFSRIGVFESIFKRVSNRYQEKSRAWSTTEAAELAGSGTPKSLK